MSGVSKISVTGNTIENAGTGIDMYGATCVDNIVSNNTCLSITGTYAIDLSADVEDCIIMGNNCFGEGIRNLGTGNDLVANKS